MDMCQQKVRNVRWIEACRAHTSQQWAERPRRPNIHQRQLALADNQIGGDNLTFTLKLRIDEPQVIGQLAPDTRLLHPKDSFQASPRLPRMIVARMRLAIPSMCHDQSMRRINNASQVSVGVMRR